MALDHISRLFFDASCLIAAAGSPNGGSGFLLALCAQEWLRGAISHYVLLEAANNIQGKLTPAALDHFYETLQSVPFLIAPVPRSTRQPFGTQSSTPKIAMSSPPRSPSAPRTC